MTSYKKTEPNFYTVNEVQPDKAGNVNEAFHMSNMDGLDVPNTGSKAVVHINRALSESGQPPGCFVRRPVAITLVLLTVLIIAVVAVIMAMFGPGNVRLKYTSELSEPNDTPTKGNEGRVKDVKVFEFQFHLCNKITLLKRWNVITLKTR